MIDKQLRIAFCALAGGALVFTIHAIVQNVVDWNESNIRITNHTLSRCALAHCPAGLTPMFLHSCVEADDSHCECVVLPAEGLIKRDDAKP